MRTIPNQFTCVGRNIYVQVEVTPTRNIFQHWRVLVKGNTTNNSIFYNLFENCNKTDLSTIESCKVNCAENTLMWGGSDGSNALQL